MVYRLNGRQERLRLASNQSRISGRKGVGDLLVDPRSPVRIGLQERIRARRTFPLLPSSLRKVSRQISRSCAVSRTMCFASAQELFSVPGEFPAAEGPVLGARLDAAALAPPVLLPQPEPRRSSNGYCSNPCSENRNSFAPIRERNLARISHELSATAPDPSASAAFRFVGLLDVPSSTPPVPSGRAPCSDGVSDSSRRKPVRKAGYEPMP